MGEAQRVKGITMQLVEQNTQGVSNKSAQYPGGEVPQVTRPHTLHLEALTQLPEHYLYALPYARQHFAPTRVRILAALAVRGYQLYALLFSQLVGKDRSPVVAISY